MSLLTDQDRFWFLQELDESEDVDVTGWEAKFIETQLRFYADRPDDVPEGSFTPAQRNVIKRLHDSYGALL